MVPWARPSLQRKRHLDRFSRLAGLTTVTDRQNEGPTDYATRSETIDRIDVRCTGTEMRPYNNNDKLSKPFDNRPHRRRTLTVHFLQRAQCSHCKRCISYGNSVCPSVRLSVRPSVTRRYCVKTRARSTVQFAPLDSKMCLVL